MTRPNPGKADVRGSQRCENAAMLRIGTVVVGVADLARAEKFYTEALGYVPLEESRTDEWVTLQPADGGGPRLSLEFSETRVLHHATRVRGNARGVTSPAHVEAAPRTPAVPCRGTTGSCPPSHERG